MAPTATNVEMKGKTRKKRLLIGVTGSVAAIKLPEIVNGIGKLKIGPEVEVRIVATDNSQHFFRPASILPSVMYTDKHEWKMWQKMADPVLHIELRKWADLLLIAPLDANTLAKIANGVCDNLLTSIVRAWDPCKPLLFAPAMNSYMYENTITRAQIDFLKAMGHQEIPVMEKKLACGDLGLGAMAEVGTIVEVINNKLISTEVSLKDDRSIHELVLRADPDAAYFNLASTSSSSRPQVTTSTYYTQAGPHVNEPHSYTPCQYGARGVR